MARHEITVPVNKAMNDNNPLSRYRLNDITIYYDKSFPIESDTIYVSNVYPNVKGTEDAINNMGLEWDANLIPAI